MCNHRRKHTDARFQQRCRKHVQRWWLIWHWLDQILYLLGGYGTETRQLQSNVQSFSTQLIEYRQYFTLSQPDSIHYTTHFIREELWKRCRHPSTILIAQTARWRAVQEIASGTPHSLRITGRWGNFLFQILNTRCLDFLFCLRASCYECSFVGIRARVSISSLESPACIFGLTGFMWQLTTIVSTLTLSPGQQRSV